MSGVVLQLFPELTDVNGDAQNALVLARRAAWAGAELTVVPLHLGDRVPNRRPAALVLGSCTDTALPRLLAALQAIREPLDGWLRTRVPLLAVGAGMEALGRSIRLDDGEREGLGFVPADAVPLAVRVADDLMVDAPEGRLLGYENHARGLRLAPGTDALGTVVRGVGDGRGVDGVRHGSILGTRMHGPVLAKNPLLADALLASILERPVVVAGAAAAFVDAQAAAARAAMFAS